MALSRVKTWNAAETLTASDLNAEFNNICNHFGSLDNDDIDSTASFIMGELIVGSGITSADGGQLHVHTGSAGTIQASADADEAVFENSGASGVTILSGATSTGNIAFGDSGDADNGLLKYTHGATPTLGITVNATAVQSIAAAATTLAHDLAVYQDANNADSQIALGTSATEALFVEALNGASNKTLEELRFTTKTASGTANHGKMSWYVDEVNIGNVNDAGITLESGMIFAGNLTGNVTGNTSGTAATVTSGTQAAITTCANLTTVGTVTTGTWSGVIDGSATMTLGSDATGDIYYRDASGFLERLAAGADGYVLTGTGAGSIPAWEAVSAGVSLSGSTNNTIATVTGANALEGEADLTFASNKLTVFGTTGTGTAPPGVINLSTRETTVVDNDQLGRIDFQAPAETGTDAILVSASLWAEAEATFAADNNSTALVFATNTSAAAAEKMRLDSVGRLGVGCDAPTTYGAINSVSHSIVIGDTSSGNGNLTIANSTSGNGRIAFTNSADNTNQAYIRYNHSNNEMDFYVNGAGRLTIDSSGDFAGSSNADISDARLKENVVELTGCLTKVNALRGVSYNFLPKANKNDDLRYGLVAQEVEAVIPEIVWDKSIHDVEGVEGVEAADAVLYVEGDEIPEGKNIGDVKTPAVEAVEAVEAESYKSLHYTGLIPVFIEAIKELTARITALESA